VRPRSAHAARCYKHQFIFVFIIIAISPCPTYSKESPPAVARDRKALRMARLVGFEISTDFLDG
jgi:hypothetical protein